MPRVPEEAASGLFAYVFIIFITVITWWLYEGGAKPTKPAQGGLRGAVSRGCPDRSKFSVSPLQSLQHTINIQLL